MSRINSDLHIQGHFSASSMNVPAAAINNAAVQANANIDPAKLGHEFRAVYQQEATANAAAEARVIHVARAAGTVEAFAVGLVTPPDTASGSDGRTAIVDLKKNGASVLTSTVTLSSTNTAYVSVAGTIGTVPYVAGDVFTVMVTLGAGVTGTHAKGVFAAATLREAAA